MIVYQIDPLRDSRWAELTKKHPRASAVPPGGLEPAEAFYFHTVDLLPKQDEIFRRFHKDSIQRKIRRAERERLTYEEGRSDALLENFYQLLLRTRRRQSLPPHPR